MKKLEFEKWRAIRASVGGVGDVLAWVMYLRRWRASVHNAGDLPALVSLLVC